jgi:hypothetical protein
VRRQNALHCLKGGGVDQRGMLALILDATPAHNAEVVAVTEDLVQPINGHRPGGAVRRRAVSQTPGPQLVGQLRKRVVAGRVGLESPADERCPFVVDDDGAHLVPGHFIADVAVANRRNMWCPAG